ncbi:malonic semialdehyde reductase [Demequina globuliformis]|uniref:malonic semialdehyde reductase n=1 Tax=Demequina globuliformis TaxID=676202 RepID=UPI00078153A1|nr:malonic semialdehyde reductase [Demequina globuliformis]
MSPFILDDLALERLFTGARSNIRFADQPVTMDTITQVWDLIKWGPTANNTVPLRIAGATSPHARARVLAHAAEGNRAKVEAAPLVLIAARDERFHDHFGVTGGTDTAAARFEGDPEARTRFAHTNAMLQTGYLIVGLRAAGLAVRPLGGFNRAGLDADLFADSPWRSEVLLLVGYPTDDHGAGDRKGRIDAADAIKEI